MYITRFTVEGKGLFPFDMLRFDRCYPDTVEAVYIMTAEEDRDFYYNMRQIDLAISHPNIDGARVTPARWESHGWRVISELDTSTDPRAIERKRG